MSMFLALQDTGQSDLWMTISDYYVRINGDWLYLIWFPSRKASKSERSISKKLETKKKKSHQNLLSECLIFYLIFEGACKFHGLYFLAPILLNVTLS